MVTRTNDQLTNKIAVVFTNRADFWKTKFGIHSFYIKDNPGQELTVFSNSLHILWRADTALLSC